MPTKRLTDAGLERLATPKSGRIEIFDALAPGLIVRVGGRRKIFQVIARVGGRRRRMALGVFPGMKIAEAREAAREALALAQGGVDPVTRRAEERADLQHTREKTVAVVVEDYVNRYAKLHQRSWKDSAARLRNHLVRLHGDKPISDLRKADILRMVDIARARGLGVGANRALANAKAFLTWCVENDLIERSPAQGVRPPAAEVSRDRILTDDELQRVWLAADADGYPYRDIVKLLILTGQRRDEVAAMTWSELDFRERSWLIAAERNKSGRPHSVPLSQGALEVFSGVEQIGPMLFPAQTAPQGPRPFSGWGRAKARLDAASGVSGWRLHDLRRTAASGMARLGFEPHVVERVLNHATSAAGPLARVYQRYSYDAEKAEALEAWAAHVMKIAMRAHGRGMAFS